MILVAILVPVGLLVYESYVPHLLLNGTTRYLYQYKDMNGRNNDVNLMPGLFKGGEAKDQVEAQLLDAGLDSWNTTRVPLPPGAQSIQIFRLSAGIRNLACGSELFVKIGYDATNSLVLATVDQGGACL
ncbi:MAG: hypothetical protein ACOH2N_10585 [Devosia sp.]